MRFLHRIRNIISNEDCYQLTISRRKYENEYSYYLSRSGSVCDYEFTIYDTDTCKFSVVTYMNDLLTEDIFGVHFKTSDMIISRWELVPMSLEGFKLMTLLSSCGKESCILTGDKVKGTGITSIQDNLIPIYEFDTNEVFPMPKYRTIYDVILMYVQMGRLFSSNSEFGLINSPDDIVIFIIKDKLRLLGRYTISNREESFTYVFKIKDIAELKSLFVKVRLNKEFEPYAWS